MDHDILTLRRFSTFTDTIGDITRHCSQRGGHDMNGA